MALAPAAAAADEEAAVKKMIVDWYAAFATDTPEAEYRKFLTDDYVLLENGELMGIEGDIAMMKNRAPGFQRKDRFDFKSVTVDGDVAYTVYFLESDMDDDKMKRHRRWLESAVLRRIDGRWRAALLHSTKIVSTDTAR
jgi:ketosteroid isomerase-like protein